MAENEAYRVDIVIDVSGDEQAKGKLKAMDKFMESTKRRAQMLDKVRISPAARLIDKISGPAKKIQSVLSSMAKRTWSVTIRAKDMVTGTIKKIFNAITSPLGLIGIGVSGAAAFQGLVRAPLELAGNMEQSQIAFETMLGGADKAKKMLTDLQRFAAVTPFEFPQLQDASKKLLAFGFSAESIIPMMTSIGNAAAGLGLGAEGIDRITLAIGQLKAKGKVQGDEMMQLTEAGIPAWDMLAKSMGKSTAEVMKMSQKGLIPADKAINALITGMNERFPNMMDKQSRSLQGLWSTIKDTFNMQILYRWGEGLRKAIEPRVQKLVDWFGKNQDTINKWGDTLERIANEAGTYIMNDLGKAFNIIKIRYLDNPKFQRLDFSGKINFIIGDVSAALSRWFQTTGAPAVAHYGILLGKELMKATLTGITSAIMESPLLSMLLGAYISAKIPGPLPVKIIVGISIAAMPSVLRILERLTTPAEQITEAKINAAYEEQKQAFETLNKHKATSNEPLYKGTAIRQYKPGIMQRVLNVIKPHSIGGIFRQPHLGLVAESGPESIIPLSSRLRFQALNLWEETGRRLGVQQYATGGIITPTMATAVNINISGVNINLAKNEMELDEDKLAYRIGWQILRQIKNHMENKS